MLLLIVLFAAAELPAGLKVQNAGGINAVTVGSASVYQGSSPVLLQTHARRDVVGRGPAAARELVVPQAEEKFFTNPAAWWELFWETRFHDYDARQSKWPVAAGAVVAARVRGVRGGEHFSAGGLEFDVLDTPGYTAGSVSYLATVGGKRVAFTGDLIYDGGRLMDLYSLQDAVPEAVTSTRVAGRNTVRGYHGYQFKIAQEAITLVVFIVFAYLYLGEPLRWNYLVSMLLIAAAVGFAFWGKT